MSLTRRYLKYSGKGVESTDSSMGLDEQTASTLNSAEVSKRCLRHIVCAPPILAAWVIHRLSISTEWGLALCLRTISVLSPSCTAKYTRFFILTRLRAYQPQQKFSYQTLLVISEPMGRLALLSISKHFWTVFVAHSLFSNCLSDTCPISYLSHWLPNQTASWTLLVWTTQSENPTCFGRQQRRDPHFLSHLPAKRSISLQSKAPYLS